MNQKKHLKVKCPRCDAEAKNYCVTVAGKNPGKFTNAHAERVQLSLLESMNVDCPTCGARAKNYCINGGRYARTCDERLALLGLS